MKPIKNFLTDITSFLFILTIRFSFYSPLFVTFKYIPLYLSSKTGRYLLSGLDNPRLGCYRVRRHAMEQKEKKITFVLGGSRSGKSRYALFRAGPYSHKAFIATALPIDEEMQERITLHQKERDPSFRTFEAPYDLGKTIRLLPPGIDIAIVDCLTVWLGNLMYRYGDHFHEAKEMETFMSTLTRIPCSLILVSNEVGLGIIPPDPQTRRFRDEAGRLNQRVAALADEVIFVVSGLPIELKKTSG